MISRGWTPEPFQFDNPRQERIYQNLASIIGPGPATFYRDACRLKSLEPPLETASHLVAHLLREIESGLRDVLEPIVVQEASIETKGKERHKTEIQAILKCLEIPVTDDIAKKWLDLAGYGERKLHAIRFSKQDKEKREDSSDHWKGILGDPCKGPYSKDLRCRLASAVLRSAETLIDLQGKTVIESLEEKSFNIFHRIGMHLRLKWPSLDPEGTERIIIDSNLFNQDHLHCELTQLLQEQFENFSSNTKEKYLLLIAKGIKPETWQTFENKEERERYIRLRQYKKLWPIQSFLNEEWEIYFEKLTSEFRDFNNPNLPDSHISVEVFDRPSTPKSVEELHSMKLAELISFLKMWQPPVDHFGPSPAGLGGKLRSLVSSEPMIYAAAAEQFAGLDPTYIRGIISGLNEAAKNGIAFPWRTVFNLCIWALDQPRELPLRKDVDSDPNWIWTRREIADLLSTGFRARSVEIPFELRETAWGILEQLVNDPDPTPEYEASYYGSKMDPITRSINTVRGVSMHALLHYALWVRRHKKCPSMSFHMFREGFEDMPEVREILDIHLDPKCDSSLAIHSVYGQWLHTLVSLDLEWVTRNLTNIFPTEAALKSMRDTAWVSYLTTSFSCENLNIFDILIAEYRNAIQLIGTKDERMQHIIDKDERLVEHLMVIYCHSKLNLEDTNSLVSYFYRTAPDALRAYAIDFLGRELYKKGNGISENIIIRLQDLWISRIDELKATMSKGERSTEPIAFGWWFVSGKFEKHWALEQLKDAIMIAGKVEPDYHVLECLSKISAEMPEIVVECLELIVKDNKEDLEIIRFNSEEIQAILNAAINSDSHKASKIAKEIVNILVSRGHIEYRDLII